jgi:Bacterial type III secretion protein (HrpB7)
MNQPVRSLKVVSASRQRKGRRIEADIVAQRRRLQDAQAQHADRLQQVQRCEEDERRLQQRIALLKQGGFSISALLAMEQVEDTLAAKTAAARKETEQSSAQVDKQKQALQALTRQLARNHKQVEFVEERIVYLVEQSNLQEEDAQAEETEETAAAAASMAARQAAR